VQVMRLPTALTITDPQRIPRPTPTACRHLAGDAPDSDGNVWLAWPNGQRAGVCWRRIQLSRAEDLVNAWAYARSHAAEIEAQIRENETA